MILGQMKGLTIIENVKAVFIIKNEKGQESSVTSAKCHL